LRVDEAVAAERRIKGWPRSKKEAMMRGDFAALSALARQKKERRDEESDRSPFAPHPSRRRFAPLSGRPLPVRSLREPLRSQWNLGLTPARDEGP